MGYPSAMTNSLKTALCILGFLVLVLSYFYLKVTCCVNNQSTNEQRETELEQNLVPETSVEEDVIETNKYESNQEDYLLNANYPVYPDYSVYSNEKETKYDDSPYNIN